MPRDDARHPAPRRSRLRRIGTLALVLGAALSSGCSWGLRERPVRAGEALVLQSAVVRAPADPDWDVVRAFEAGRRVFLLTHATGGKWDRAWTIMEVDGSNLSGPDALSEYRRRELAGQAVAARSLLADPDATISEIPLELDPRFGKAAIQVAIRAEESDAKAGLLVKRFVESASLTFASPAGPQRTCVVVYERRSLDDRESPALDSSWRALLGGIELRPADGAHVREAARADDFPKQFAEGLARRPLTLPRNGFQWTLWRDRWIAPGGWDGSWGLAYGATDHLEIDAPGYVRYAFGEHEALTRPEWAVGAGWAGFEHDAIRGSVWEFWATVQGRKRIAADVALRGQAVLTGTHESRTDRSHAGGGAAAGVVWDVHDFVTLGLETGWLTEQETEARRNLAWVGGSATPLVTVHLPLLDVGVDFAAAWEERRAPGVLAGFTLRLIL